MQIHMIGLQDPELQLLCVWPTRQRVSRVGQKSHQHVVPCVHSNLLFPVLVWGSHADPMMCHITAGFHQDDRRRRIDRFDVGLTCSRQIWEWFIAVLSHTWLGDKHFRPKTSFHPISTWRMPFTISQGTSSQQIKSKSVVCVTSPRKVWRNILREEVGNPWGEQEEKISVLQFGHLV